MAVSPMEAVMSTPKKILATLDLTDDDELRAHDFVGRFFAKDGAHKLVDIARARQPAEHPDLIMLSEERVDDGTAWAVYRYEIKPIRLSWLGYATYDEASAAFSTALAVPTGPRLMTAADADGHTV